jgi:methylated-DNA-protein-cysteine methyltransferase-like protein
MSVYERVYKIVMRIPKGRVLTYGLISDLLGGRLSAQGVGWALKALPAYSTKKKKGESSPHYNSRTVPWHRVINSRGGTSTHKVPDIPPDLQRELLEAEGVIFDEEEKIDLPNYLWIEGLSETAK